MKAMTEAEAWRYLEGLWRAADPNRDRTYCIGYDPTKHGLCWSTWALYVQRKVSEACSVSMLRRVQEARPATLGDLVDYYWPPTAEYDSTRADWCAKFARECDEEDSVCAT